MIRFGLTNGHVEVGYHAGVPIFGGPVENDLFRLRYT